VYYGLLGAWWVSWTRPLASWIRHSWLIGVGGVSLVFVLGHYRPVFQLVFFDLGKTESAFVSFANGAHGLINTAKRAPSNQAYWVLRPFLMASGIQKVDHLLLTHVDGGHAGGFRTLTRHVLVERVWVPTGMLAASNAQNFVPRAPLRRGAIREVSQASRIGFGSGAEIEILESRKAKPPIFRIREASASVLYLGDLDPETLVRLLRREDLDDEIVFLPHDELGLSEAGTKLLAKVRPQFIVSNQRDRIDELRAQLESLVDSRLLFLHDLGAIQFFRRNGAWAYRTFGTSVRVPPPLSR